MKSQFSTDKQFEENIVQYIRNNEILERLKLSNIEHVSDRETQKKGIDIIAQFKGETCFFDLKSIAGDIPTFAQEMMNTKSQKIGWLFNDELKTTHYIFTYHIVKGAKNYSEGKRLIDKDISNIVASQFIIVQKKDLKDLIKKRLFISCDRHTAETISNIITEDVARRNITEKIEKYTVRTDKKGNRVLSRYFETKNEAMWITYSCNIAEHPINIVIRKEELKKVCCGYLEMHHGERQQYFC